MRLERIQVTLRETRALTGDNLPPRSFEGYGSVFDTIDSYNDTIAKGAFKATLREWKATKKNPKLLLQHGGGFFGGSAIDMVPIGAWDELREDDHGLYGRGHLFNIDTPRTLETYTALSEGELDGLSIGFRTRKFKMDEESGVRTLTDVKLYEISLVTFPANDPARVTDVRSDLPSEREFERWLRREVGLTANQAKAIIASGYRALLREATPDPEDEDQPSLSSVEGRELLTLFQRRGHLLTT